MFGSDPQSVIDNHFGGAVDVGLVLEPLAVAHAGAEMENETPASESRVIAEKLANNRDSSAPVRVAHLIEFFLHTHGE
jgi:hypothetical protein